MTVPISPQINKQNMLRYCNNNIEGTRQIDFVTSG